MAPSQKKPAYDLVPKRAVSYNAFMKKILVTGSNGLLGQKIIRRLQQNPGVNFLATSLEENRLSFLPAANYHELDVTKPEEIRRLFCSYHPDAVIHTAAMTLVDDCERSEDLCRKMNVYAVESLVDACEKINAHLIHLSTDFIFDGKNGPYKEEDAPNPESVYASSKLESELIVQKAKCPWSILRTILVFGTGENMKRSNIVLLAIEKLRQGQMLKMITDHVRAPTLAEDLAEACVSAALKTKTGIFHVSGKDIVSIYEFALLIAEVFGFDSNLVQPTDSSQYKVPAKRPARTGFILEKAIRELDYKPHSLRESLELVKKQMGM